MWTLIFCIIITLLALVGGVYFSSKVRDSRNPPVESSQTETSTSRVSFWKKDSWKTFGKWLFRIIFILIIASVIWWQHTWIIDRYSKLVSPPPQAHVWQMSWHKNNDQIGTRQDARQNHFNISFKRRTANMIEFDVYCGSIEHSQVIATFWLKKQSDGSKWKWVGDFNSQTVADNYGKARFNEEISPDGKLIYTGEQSGLPDEWIYTIIE